MKAQGVLIMSGTFVDTTVIPCAQFDQKRKQKRGFKMHNTNEGNQSHFAMKANVGGRQQDQADSQRSDDGG